MSRTFIQPGDTLTFVAPTGGVTSGTPVLIGDQLVIPETTAAATEEFEGTVCGVHTLGKASGQTWATGDPLFWDDSAGVFTSDPAAGRHLGEAGGTAASADTTGPVKLLAPENKLGTFQIRKRFTIAEVNAGIELIPAVPGRQIRMVAAKAIAIGGAAGAVTTVDILATQTTSVKLVAFAQASLLQSAVLKDGETGAAVLADGASYVANDVNTAVTVGKTGASITTATHIDFIVSYALD